MSNYMKGKTIDNPALSQHPESSRASHEFEVFLSFRGKDTSKGFTDNLYNRMNDEGIIVFKDNVNRRYGEDIASNLSDAIKNSEIAIPILSTNYAESTWCLDELACILECKNSRDQKVIPIFYDVKPSEVRNQTGSYATAFKDHVKKYDEVAVKRWRKALVEVSSLKGLELEETAGREGELIKMITTNVLSKLKKSHLLVPENLVGIDDQAKSIMALLQMSNNDVRIIGIWGLGGIGKTTLAKFVFNQILGEFERTSFLKHVHETSLQHKGLEDLQTQLVRDLSKEAQRRFTSIDEGIKVLKRRFCKKKVLVLLDDVDQIHQLHALVAKIKWFGPGSRIIITTRNKKVINLHQVSGFYEVKEMTHENALQLFCKHALKEDAPSKDEFGDLSRYIVVTTGGLPLALEVIGSSLYQEEQPVWEETLQKLKDTPEKKVQQRLKISYDRLNDDQRQMFLDVACLLSGEDIDVVIQVWESRNFAAERGKSILLAMCLIKIGEDGKIWMHDQLRDLGREINRKEPLKRSGLWRVDEARDALEKQVVNNIEHGSTMVEALHLCYDPKQDKCVTDEQLRNFPNIWFLGLYYAELVGDFQNLLPHLRWLRWLRFSPKCFTNNLNLDKLIVLDLSYSWITDDCELWSSIQTAKMLKVLNLASCTGLCTLDVPMLLKLERLILDNCLSLKEISSLGKLENLLLLTMKNCCAMEKLPESIEELKTLRELDLSGTRFPTLPSSIESLTNLQRLTLARSAIGILPNSIGKLKSLCVLDLSYTMIETLPSSICDLEDLQALHVANTSIYGVPYAFIDSEKPHMIDHSNIPRKPWTWFIGTGSTLRFSGDERGSINQSGLIGTRLFVYTPIRKLPFPSKLMFLKTLDFYNCKQLEEVEGLDGLEQLRVLNIRRCGALKKLWGLSKLKSLKSLFFLTCGNLVELEGLDELERLERLRIQSCDAIEKLPSLSKLKLLRALDCSYCKKLQDLEGLDQLEALEELKVSWCGAMEKLPSLSKLRRLKMMDCLGFEKLQEVEGLEGLERLERLRIQSCKAIEKLQNLSKLKLLRILDCSDCEKLQELEGLDQLEALAELKVSRCSALEKLPSLSKLSHLRDIDCWECEKLQEIEGLDGLERLNSLSIRSCKAIEKLPNLSKLKSLRVLDCSDCEKLQELEGLDQLEALEELDVSRCRLMEKLPSLFKHRRLIMMDCWKCNELQEIQGPDRFKELEFLMIRGCKIIGHLPNLQMRSEWRDSCRP